jgi:hypothetical protein
MERVTITATALDMVKKLEGRYGLLMFHQSGGCCDGSAPMCYPKDDFIIGQADVFLGSVGDDQSQSPFYISGAQFEYWKHTHLTVDLVPGRGSGFSVEAPEGFRFLIRSRIYTDAEYFELEKQPILLGRRHI